ncbi:uncharacterized protein LOC113363702 [Ctenocephalides felis]|uniref:uncharacterized protein LOC113363702 n=1 Tax=Ctenocephalides felis TaxID=7515 RepID=UPI000E6E5627|nr:uncharacterized protein LOC113363702 [Ctenocephalides felis]
MLFIAMCTLGAIASPHGNNGNGRDLQIEEGVFVVPQAKVEAYHPRGLRVSIPHQEGIELFAFHGSVNKPMVGLEAGQLSRDITAERNGYWSFYDPQVKLKVGDVLNYWLFVQKDKLGYRKDDQSFVVRELLDAQNPEPTLVEEKPKQNGATPANVVEVHCDPREMTMLYIQVNHTKSELQILENDVKRLTKELEGLREIQTELLTELNSTDSNMLLLTGGSPLDIDPLNAVVLVIREKLLFSQDTIVVTNASRLGDGSIWFTVNSFEQKMKLLARSRSRLANSKLKIESYNPTEEIHHLDLRFPSDDAHAER